MKNRMKYTARKSISRQEMGLINGGCMPLRFNLPGTATASTNGGVCGGVLFWNPKKPEKK